VSNTKPVVVTHDTTPATVPANAVTPAQMLALAVERGADLQQLEKLMDLQERWEANNARKGFVAAMSAFKANPPRIVKDKLVDFTTGRGRTTYLHATLGAVVAAVIDGLSKHGITHRWSTAQEGNRITVICTLTHIDGHSESNQLTAAADESGGKNAIQAVASTVSYLQRYTLLAATGLATYDQDDDARAAADAPRITEAQVADLEALLDEVGADRAKFLAYLKVESLSEVKASEFSAVVKLLERKRAV